MFVVESYPLAVALCVLTMLCWGSWANTRKLARKDWRFELFYWDYALGVLLLALIMGLTLGSSGTLGRSFAADLSQASGASIGTKRTTAAERHRGCVPNPRPVGRFDAILDGDSLHHAAGGNCAYVQWPAA